MATDLRVVLDTNVVVSAMLLPLSAPRRALEHALHVAQHLDIFTACKLAG